MALTREERKLLIPSQNEDRSIIAQNDLPLVGALVKG